MVPSEILNGTAVGARFLEDDNVGRSNEFKCAIRADRRAVSNMLERADAWDPGGNLSAVVWWINPTVCGACGCVGVVRDSAKLVLHVRHDRFEAGSGALKAEERGSSRQSSADFGQAKLLIDHRQSKTCKR